MTTNINNLARTSNYKVFLPLLSDTILYAQGVSLPGFNLSPIPTYSQSGVPLKLEGDSLEMDPISVSLIVDENYTLPLEIYKKFKDISHPSNGTKGSDFNFTCGIEITDNTGNPLFCIEFYQCALQSVSPLNLLSNTDDDILTLDLTFEASYYEITNYLDSDKLLNKIVES